MIFGLEVALLSVLALSNDPYARTHTDPADPNSHCLWWRQGTLTFTQSDVGNPAVNPRGSEFDAVTKAWQSWQAVHTQCGNLTLTEGPHSSGGAGTPARSIGYVQNPSSQLQDLFNKALGYEIIAPGNDNLILFRTTRCSSVTPPGDACVAAGNCGNKYDCWGHDSSIIALTTTTFSTSTGQILDSDVEMNAAVFRFTTSDGPICTPPNFNNCVYTDVQNTMTHEFGHLHGLDHTSYVNPTTGKASIMRPTAPPGETEKRTIDPPTMDFVCKDAYPKGKPSHDCVPTPSGCAAAPDAPLLAIGWLVLLLRSRRRWRSPLPLGED